MTGETYFITQVTYQRIPWFCSGLERKELREEIAKVREKYPFEINAFVLLPDHFHCLWTLLKADKDFSVRLRLIKTHVTKRYGEQLGINVVFVAIATKTTRKESMATSFLGASNPR